MKKLNFYCIILFLFLGVIATYSQCTSSTVWNGSSWNNGVPDSNTEAHFSGNYTSIINGQYLEACKIYVEGNAIVTISTGDVLLVENEVNVASTAHLIFENNSSLYQVNENFQNVGNIEYKRNTTLSGPTDYTYWSSPVENQILINLFESNQLPNSGSYYYWDPSQGNFSENAISGTWINVIPTVTTMNVGRGYICSGPPQIGIQTATYIGKPNNGTITTPIRGIEWQPNPTETPCGIIKGYGNFIGNPYPSSLDADSFLSDPLNVGIIDGTIAQYSHNTQAGNPPEGYATSYTVNDFTYYNRLGGIGTGRISYSAPSSANNTNRPNGKIASGQGFFVDGLSDGNATFKNDMRDDGVGTNSQFYRNSNRVAPIERHRIWVNIENTTGTGLNPYREALVGYAEGATMGYDRAFDFSGHHPQARVNIYSFTTPETICEALNIQGRLLTSPFDTSDFIQLGYKVIVDNGQPQTIVIRADGDGMFENDQDYYLTDTHFPGQYFDIKNTNYTFTVSQTTDDRSRFRIVFINCRTNLSEVFTPIYSNAVANASSYLWTVTNQFNNQSITFTTPYNVFSFNNQSIPWPENFVSYGVTYSVVASAMVNGIQQPGIPCIVKTPSPEIEINNCGNLEPIVACQQITVPSGENDLYHDYEIAVTGPDNVTYTFPIPNNPGSFSLSDTPGLNILYGTQYTIQVKIQNPGGPELNYGLACIVTTHIPNPTQLSLCGNISPIICGNTVHEINVCQPITIRNTVNDVLGNCLTRGYNIKITGPDNIEHVFPVVYNPGTFTLSSLNFNPAYGTVYKIQIQYENGSNTLAYGQETFIITQTPSSVYTNNCGSLNNPYILPNISSGITLANKLTNCLQHDYTIRVTNSNNEEHTFEILHNPGNFNLVSSGVNPIFGETYKIEVLINNDGGPLLQYGPPCYYKVPNFPLTNLGSSQCNNYQVPTSGTNISAVNVNSYSGGYPVFYSFKLSNDSLNTPYSQIWDNLSPNMRVFQLNKFSGLLLNTTYEVQVKTTVNGIESDWGPICTITTPNALRIMQNNSDENNSESNLIGAPNPFSNNFSLNFTHNDLKDKDVIVIKVYDVLGRIIEERESTFSDLKEIKLGDSYIKNSIYLIQVSSGEFSIQTKMIKK